MARMNEENDGLIVISGLLKCELFVHRDVLDLYRSLSVVVVDVNLQLEAFIVIGG